MLSDFLGEDDWLHCHYRDKALMLARGVSAEMFFLCLFNKDGSHSRGRQMNAHMSAPELKLLSQAGPVGNGALQAVGVASAVSRSAPSPVSRPDARLCVRRAVETPSSTGLWNSSQAIGRRRRLMRPFRKPMRRFR